MLQYNVRFYGALEPSVVGWEQFCRVLCRSNNSNHSFLHSTLVAGIRAEMSSASSSDLLDEFQLLTPHDVDQVFGAVDITACSFDPCPSCLM